MMVRRIQILLLGAVLAASAPGQTLEESFRHPPASARPLTWWHWLDGNITRAGITADLEAMQRAGLGGVYLFNCGIGMPQGPVRFLQPEWLALMDHTIREAQRLGLQFGVHNCDGFSQSGGPWITPATSMKELTWSVRDVQGPAAFDAVLAQPETREGFYRDIAAIAFPVPRGGRLTGPGTGVQVRGSLPAGELAKLVDGDPATVARFPALQEGSHTIEFVFAAPCTVRSVVCCNAGPHRWEEDFPITLAAAAGGDFVPVGTFTMNWDMTESGQITAACEERPARVFRLSFRNPWAVTIGEIELSDAARVHFAEAKATRARSRGHGAERRHYDAYPGPSRARPLAPELVVARDAVQDLTARMDGAGRLRWQVPPGRWRILRVGFTSNGRRVSPATAEGRGLECDKLDPNAVRFHLEQYVGKLVEQAGPAAGRTFAALEVDSWECGIQDWTAGLEHRFRRRVGCDLRPFWPALLEGWIVDNVDVTERALWDWRRFLADQFSENYFAVVARFAAEKHLTYVGESTGRQAYLYDTAWQRNSAVPMGEFWLDQGPGQGVRVDNKVASSIAHTTGKRIVASESYTAGPRAAAWQNHPFRLKPLGDRVFCAGVNQFVFHTFAHQPYPVTGPGFTFASWGLNFNRANTWWETGRAWMEYLARCNELLREGRPVADVLWYVGEDVPNRIAWRDELHPVLPDGYDFDGCDTRALLEARVVRGRIVLPSGTDYRVLLLPNLDTMRPAVLEKVAELARAGATILGPRPRQSPSLRDLGAGDATVRRLADELWNGRILSGLSFEALFQRLHLPPDFTWRSSAPDAEILYVHRRTEEAEIYFVSNQRERVESIEAVFRAGHGTPELWDPATGEIRTLPDFRVDGDQVTVPLQLDPFGSAFVVFRGDRSPSAGRNWPQFAAVQTLAGPWQVRFPPNLGAPAAITLDRLISLSEHGDPGVRFFSGTATYRTTFESRLDAPPAGVFLDLGDVQVVAEVKLNGHELGILWKPPYRVDVGGALRPGVNELEVGLVTLWPNRMIGDAGLPDDIEWNGRGGRGPYPARWPDWLVEGRPRPSGRIAFCTRKDVYGRDDPLLPGGLLGPVRLCRSTAQTAQTADKPNIVFILADDLGQGDLGCYGQKLIRTPNLDRMAAEGTRYTQAYCGTSVCAPSRTSLVTGLHVGHTPSRGNKKPPGTAEGQWPLAAKTLTVAQVLKQQGYATACMGKWGMGYFDTTGSPLKKGFDHFFGYNCQTKAHDYFPPYLDNDERRLPLDGKTYAQNLIQSEVLDWVRQHKDGPFFLFYSVTLPHGSYEIDHLGEYENREGWTPLQKTYAAMVTRLDSDVGGLLALLKELGIDENTLVIFAGDNGSAFAEKSEVGKFFDQSMGGKLRGIKRSMYEGGLRQAALARWPGVVPAGRVTDGPWAFWDFLPTAAELAGAKLPEDFHPDGCSLVSFLQGGPAPQREYFYWELHESRVIQAVRFGDWKAVKNGPSAAIELYDLAQDAAETTDLAAGRPDLVVQAAALMKRAHVDDPNWPMAAAPKAKPKKDKKKAASKEPSKL